MSRTPATGRENLIGSLFMILSMAGFAIEDSFIKYATLTDRQIPHGQLIVMVAASGMVFFGAMTAFRRQPLFPAELLSKPLLIRGGFEIMGRLSYTLAFILAPLITATAILQATPLVVVAGAALFLGEKVGPRQWAAVVLGFFGVMLILRPWGAQFDFLTILAVLGMIGFAGRDLATRASPARLSNWQLGFIGYTMFTLAGLIIWGLQGGFTQISGAAMTYITIAAMGGITGYFALTVAMRTGDVGAVTPWRYTRLIIGAILVLIMFGEPIDLPTIIGSVIVVGSGIFTMIRRRQRQQT
ncbi:DMT family transporter [Marivivens niveibacter]|nr:DMT family transporter [Marivivens niveibacter]